MAEREHRDHSSNINCILWSSPLLCILHYTPYVLWSFRCGNGISLGYSTIYGYGSLALHYLFDFLKREGETKMKKTDLPTFLFGSIFVMLIWLLPQFVKNGFLGLTIQVALLIVSLVTMAISDIKRKVNQK